jgi:hypothetical protein
MKIFVSFLLLLVFGCTVSFSQNSSTTSLLVSCSQAMGSNNANANFQGRGTVGFPPNDAAQGQIMWKSMRGTNFRQEITDAQGLAIENVRGEYGFRASKGKRQTVPSHSVAYFRQEFNPALACNVAVGRAGIQVQFIGAESLHGRAVNHLLFSMAPKGINKGDDAMEALISEFHVFLDVADNTVFATRTWVFSDAGVANRSVWETYYSDYRLASGVLMPFSVENYIAGQKIREIKFLSVIADNSISDVDFQ